MNHNQWSPWIIHSGLALKDCRNYQHSMSFPRISQVYWVVCRNIDKYIAVQAFMSFKTGIEKWKFSKQNIILKYSQPEVLWQYFFFLHYKLSYTGSSCFSLSHIKNHGGIRIVPSAGHSQCGTLGELHHPMVRRIWKPGAGSGGFCTSSQDGRPRKLTILHLPGSTHACTISSPHKGSTDHCVDTQLYKRT